MALGILGYGAYVPRFRIKTEEIARVWGEDPDRIKKGLGIYEKAVAGVDEDTATISVEAVKIALERAGVPPQEVGALYVGSESHPYVVKSTSSIVAEAIGATPHVIVADLEFACRAGTAGLAIVLNQVKAGSIKYGIAIGADVAQGRPGDALEYSAGSGGGAYVVGEGEVVAEILHVHHYITDTPDFWRREGAPFPSHGGRFTGEPAYFKHVLAASREIMDAHGYAPSDFDYVIFHQPNAKFPIRAAKKLGFSLDKLEPGLLVPYVGNTYSGNTFVALSHVLDQAKPDSLILMVSFGSGAGSDAFILRTTHTLTEVRERGRKLQHFLDRKEYIDYATYAKLRGKLLGVGSAH